LRKIASKSIKFFYFLNYLLKKTVSIQTVQDVPGGKVNILGGHNIGHSKQKECVYMSPNPNGFRDTFISMQGNGKFVPVLN
jgi:hypothetical protein